MADWRPQPYLARGRSEGIEASILEAAVAAGKEVIAVHRSLPPIFTLRHLAHLTDTDYGLLRRFVSRSDPEPYRVFRIRKQPTDSGEQRFRVICVPDPTLLSVQRWLAKNVLAYAAMNVHPASTAYAPGCKLVDAAQPHCGCRWLIKLDVKNFFESITEIDAYRAYRALGYRPLIAMELARISTRVGSASPRRYRKRWRLHHPARYRIIDRYVHRVLGHLPQGAPTSPMLANLAMASADQALSACAEEHKLTYTRYADDLTFSTCTMQFDRSMATAAIHDVYKIIGKHGLSPNAAKTQVIPPRSRKVVLGLLVDGDTPRLMRCFKARLRMHLHYLEDPAFGPVRHAQNRGFAAVAGLRYHLQGLVSYAQQVEPQYGSEVARRLALVAWPI